jgi:hypothetical protein
MSVIKRLIGWKQCGQVIPGPLQVLCGMRRERDPEAFLERKRERLAIQQEGRGTPQPKAQPIVTPSPPIQELEAEPVALGQELPSRAAIGWYRLGMTYYRQGQGPFPAWGVVPSPTPQGKMIQRSLF